VSRRVHHPHRGRWRLHEKWGEPGVIEAAYEELSGEEFVIEDANGVFFFKEE
jgi:hypothetical protein